MLKALRYQILRGVEANGRKWIPMEEKPVRVATLLNEEDFLRDQLLVHHRNVFLEDRLHDWQHRVVNGEGRFSYYTRVAAVADVLVVFEEDRNYVPPARFDSQTGKPLDGATDKEA